MTSSTALRGGARPELTVEDPAQLVIRNDSLLLGVFQSCFACFHESRSLGQAVERGFLQAPRAAATRRLAERLAQRTAARRGELRSNISYTLPLTSFLSALR